MTAIAKTRMRAETWAEACLPLAALLYLMLLGMLFTGAPA